MRCIASSSNPNACVVNVAKVVREPAAGSGSRTAWSKVAGLIHSLMQDAHDDNAFVDDPEIDDVSAGATPTIPGPDVIAWCGRQWRFGQ